MNNIELLIQQAQAITNNGLPFMTGKEKIEIDGSILDTTLTLDEFGYMEGLNDDSGEKEEYVVITMKEHPNGFIYGSSVVTQAFKSLENQFDTTNLQTLLDFGITFKLTKQVSKNKRKYTKIEFFPN